MKNNLKNKNRLGKTADIIMLKNCMYMWELQKINKLM